MIMRQLCTVLHQSYGPCQSCTSWDAVAIFEPSQWHLLSWRNTLEHDGWSDLYIRYIPGIDIRVSLRKLLPGTLGDECLDFLFGRWRFLINIQLVFRQFSFSFVTVHTLLGDHMRPFRECIVLLFLVRTILVERYVSSVSYARSSTFLH